MSKIFVDTNIWAYAVDKGAGSKQHAARQALSRIRSSSSVVLSSQVMQEFFVVATKKLDIAPRQARLLLEDVSVNEVVAIDADLVMNAAGISLEDRLSFWDALIVAAAEKAKCRELWTEDLNPGQRIRGVIVVNPLQ